MSKDICSFCSKSSDDVVWLVQGPGVFICDVCVGACADIIAKRPKGAPVRKQKVMQCSFCGERCNEWRRSVAGPGLYICDTCVSLCAQVIARNSASKAGDPDVHLGGNEKKSN